MVIRHARRKNSGMGLTLAQRIGLRIKAFRNERGLTQEQLADLIGRTVESVSNIERGHTLPRLQTLEKIGRRLDAPLADFFDRDTAGAPDKQRRAELQAIVTARLQALSDADLEIAAKQIEALAEGKRRSG